MIKFISEIFTFIMIFYSGLLQKTLKYLLLFTLVSSSCFSYAQNFKSRDYIIDAYKEKKYGKILLKNKFWFSDITLYNREEGIAEKYSPAEIRKFVKGDSIFVSAIVNYETYGVNEDTWPNQFVLLILNDSVNLYKSYVPIGNKGMKEIFLYYKPGSGMSDISIIEDKKSSVAGAVADCRDLKQDIYLHGYEYSESYFRKLFENYNNYLKDSTTTLTNLSGQPIPKADPTSASTVVRLLKPEIVKLRSHRIYLIGFTGTGFFTINRYSYQDKRRHICGFVGEGIRPVLKTDPEALKHLDKYRNLRLLGLFQTWVIAPAFIVATIESNPDNNSGLYCALSAEAFFISGMVFYQFISQKFLHRAVVTYNRNLLKKYED